MNETFPRRPLLDRIIVREIPIEEFYEANPLEVGLDDSRRDKDRGRSDRGIVVAVSREIERGGEVGVGDTVFYDPDYVHSDPVYLNPGHRLRDDLPKYYQIRLADLKGVLVTGEPMVRLVECGNCGDKILAAHECFAVKANA